MRRVIIAVVSDTHGGHRLGLLNPNTVVYAENEFGEWDYFRPELTESQRFLWERYMDWMGQVFDFAAGDDLILIHNGDETQGKKYVDQLVSTRLADQIVIARDNLNPWYAYGNLIAVRIVAGTAAHSFAEGSSAILVREQLALNHPQVNTSVLYHGLLSINGVIVDYAHHGPGPGSRNWLHGNVARFYLRDLMQREILAGRRPPGLVLRAHFHVPVYEYLETGGWKSHFYITPAMCMMGEHGIQATRSVEEITVGILALEVVDGEIQRDMRLYQTLDIRTKETL